jgi:PPOX class probable F420-dependent enzyme
MLAVERPLATPERAHEVQRLVGPAVATPELDAHEPELVLVPADAHAESHAPVRELLQRRDLLREMDGVVKRHEHDRGAESDPLGDRGDPGEDDERVVDTSVRVDGLGADDDVLGRPDGVEAELLRRLGDPADPVGRGVAAEVRQDDAEMHDAILVRRRVADSRVARLATLDADGRPHLVPITFVLVEETLYSAVDAKPKRSRTLRRIENARRRPDVTVLVDHYDDDWTRLWWVRLRGRARVLEAGDEAERALTLLVAKYEQYQHAAPGLPVLAVDIDEWRGWPARA